MDLPNPGASARLIAKVERGQNRAALRGHDLVAREEPLELRLGRLPLGVLMRTPGHDHELGVGFAVTEGILSPKAPLPRVAHCAEGADEEESVLIVTPRSELRVPADELVRRGFSSASCGTCGKASLNAALRVAPPLEHRHHLSEAWIQSLEERLRSAQPGFARTGGLHAAGLARPNEAIAYVREDVGRHNAADKCVGAALLGGAKLEEWVLVLSGRVSFEMVQKSLFAGISAIVAVGAPTSLAIDLALASNITLIGFARRDRFCVYAGEDFVHV